MKPISIIALAISGAFVVSASAYAAQDGVPPSVLVQTAAMVGPNLALGNTDEQREVIQPPSSIDPGMALDPPQTGAKMPIIHPPGTPGGKLVLPH
jgi:hypothetical protein